MNRQLLKLQKDIIQGAPQGVPAYDRYAYNGFAWSALHFSYRAQSEEEKQLCLYLRGVAIGKAKGNVV